MGDDILIALLSSGGATVLVVGYLAVVLFKNPEKIEKWASIINKMVCGFGGIFRSAHKRYVKYDLQSRINDFTKRVSITAPYFENTRIAVEWTETNQDKKAFLDNGKVVLRLRREDPGDLNFVHGAYWSVSTCLLPKVKRYISPSQRQALDLYMTARIIEQEKYQVIEHFLEHYLHPYLEDKSKKIAQIYDQFNRIDRYGAFYPVLLQELYFLSLKVYGAPRDDRIIIEVTRLIDFLEKVASRKIGEEIDLDFTGEHCRFAIVIIGKSFKMSGEGPRIYVNYIQRLLSDNAETVYVLGKYENHEFLDGVCACLEQSCEVYRTYHYKGMLTYEDEPFEQEQYLVVLRTRGISVYQGNEAQSRRLMK